MEAARSVRPVDAGHADALLTEAITRAVLGGRIAVAPRYAERCAGAPALDGERPPDAKLGLLTPQELQVARVIAQGMNNVNLLDPVG
ncbi:hypothetical protein [Actinomadura chokoriensis]|uniref:Uncharacterized protein n=1 Tax=Actinomadura chokoriensis TaxID=454156 RepID=A0ABV4QWW9_9ACTN